MASIDSAPTPTNTLNSGGTNPSPSPSPRPTPRSTDPAHADPAHADATHANTDTAAPSNPAYTYPEQRHAGKVGYGPNYSANATLADRLTGLEAELKGKLKHDPAMVQYGREVFSGEVRRKKLTGEDEPSPFENAEDEKDGKKKSSKKRSSHDGGANKNDNKHNTPTPSAADAKHGATVAPKGTAAPEAHRAGPPAGTVRDVDAHN